MDGRKAQVKGKCPCVENPSSASATATTGTKAPGSPEYFSLTEYPPGADIEYELTWDGHRAVAKVPRWAHEKWLLKYHPDGTKRTCEDHPNSASATADAAASGTKALKRPCEDLVENPSSTAVAYGTKAPGSSDYFSSTIYPLGRGVKRPNWQEGVKIPSETAAAYAEMMALDPTLVYVFPDLFAYHMYPGRYRHIVEGGRIILKVNKWTRPYFRAPGTIITSEVKAGCFRAKPPKEDPLPATAGVKETFN